MMQTKSWTKTMGRGQIKRGRLVMAVLLMAAFSGAAQAAPNIPILPAGTATPPTSALQKSLLMQMQDAFTSIAQAVEPTVVNIKAVRPLPAGMSAVGDGSDANPLLGPPGRGSAPRGPSHLEATGSGVIVRPDGYILTNDHVIDGALGGQVTVTLSDGREFVGTVYPDYKSDLAIVKINPGAAGLPVAQFAGPGAVVPGQWALAVGSPFDLQNTITVGIISAVNRHQEIRGEGEERYYPDLLQTDAAINPGNSGGPLFNIDGKVVGINVAIESPVEGSAGVGFAIPVAIAQRVANALISQGKVVRGYLGLTPEDLTPALQTQYGQTDGAFVRDVQLSGPAGTAGLRAADIVTRYNDKSIAGELDLREAISASAPLQKVRIGYVRDGKPQTLVATVDAAPALAGDASSAQTPTLAPRPSLGLAVRALSAHDRLALSLPAGTRGVVVVSVTPGGAAESSGLVPGAVIQKVNGDTITGKADFERATSSLQGAVTLLVLSQDPRDSQLYQSAKTLRL